MEFAELMEHLGDLIAVAESEDFLRFARELRDERELLKGSEQYYAKRGRDVIAARAPKVTRR